MLPTLAEVLALPAVRRGEPHVLTGTDRLGQPVRWVHVSEVSWIAGLLEGGELILTTGIALPRAGADLRRYVRELADVGVCGVAVELGRRYRTLPAALVQAAGEADLPLVELRRETRFVAVTQQVHTLILEARMRELTAADELHGHRTLLTSLAVGAQLPAGAADRAAGLGVPLERRSATALVVRRADGAADGTVLRELAGRLVETCAAQRVPALVGAIDERTVAAVLAADRGDRPARTEGTVRRLVEALHEVTDRRRGTGLVVAVGTSGVGVAGAQSSLREAARVADHAAGQPVHRGWFRTSDVRLHGLLHELRDTAALREFVDRELGPLLAWDAAHGSSLVAFVSAFCAAGGNKTAAAAELFISRAALYERISRVERVLGVDLSDPQVAAALHVALLGRTAIEDPGAAVAAVD